jgi:hypothetical protein
VPLFLCGKINELGSNSGQFFLSTVKNMKKLEEKHYFFVLFMTLYGENILVSI